MTRVRAAYGASPLHLLAVMASLAIVGYAFFMIFKAPAPESTLIFFVAAIFAHDMVAFPLYSGLNRIAGGALGGRDRSAGDTTGVPPLNCVRIPFILSLISFVVFFPLILNLSADRYVASTGLDPDVFFGRWLGICAVLFTGSALLYAIRLRRTARAHPVENSEG